MQLMKSTSLTSLLLLMVSLVSFQAYATPNDAFEMLGKMSGVLQDSSYQGKFVLYSEGSMQSLQIQRGVTQGTTYESLQDLSAMGSRILRRGMDFLCLKEGYPTLHWSWGADPTRDRLLHLAENKEVVVKHYKVSVVSGGQVAGRAVSQVIFAPLDKLRFGYRIWLDSETYFPLKIAFEDHQSKLIETMEYVEFQLATAHAVEFVSEIDALFAQQEDQKKIQSAPQEQGLPHDEPVPADGFAVSWIPVGFAELDMAPKTGRRLYSDGIASFSLHFFKPSGAGASPMRQGASLVETRHLTVADETLAVMLMGEIPLKTADRIFASIRVAD